VHCRIPHPSTRFDLTFDTFTTPITFLELLIGESCHAVRFTLPTFGAGETREFSARKPCRLELEPVRDGIEFVCLPHSCRLDQSFAHGILGLSVDGSGDKLKREERVPIEIRQDELKHLSRKSIEPGRLLLDVSKVGEVVDCRSCPWSFVLVRSSPTSVVC